MSEPITTDIIANGSMAGITIAKLLSTTDAGIFISAFAGSVIFILIDTELKNINKALMFFSALIVGIVFADTTAELFTMSIKHQSSKELGALLSSALVTRLLVWCSTYLKNPNNMLTLLKLIKRGGR